MFLFFHNEIASDWLIGWLKYFTCINKSLKWIALPAFPFGKIPLEYQISWEWRFIYSSLSFIYDLYFWRYADYKMHSFDIRLNAYHRIVNPMDDTYQHILGQMPMYTMMTAEKNQRHIDMIWKCSRWNENVRWALKTVLFCWIPGNSWNARGQIYCVYWENIK